MAFPLGDIQQGVQPFRKFWNAPIQKQSNHQSILYNFLIYPDYYSSLQRS